MLEFNFSPFPILETNRLRLRRLQFSDIPRLFALRSNAENMKYIPRNAHKNFADTQVQLDMINSKIESNEGINWVITTKTSDEFMGIIGHYKIDAVNHRSELGYMILPEFAKHGFISESVNEIIKYGFEILNLHSTEAVIHPENKASEKILQNLGFLKEAHLKENEYFNGEFWDSVIYSLLKKNYTVPL